VAEGSVGTNALAEFEVQAASKRRVFHRLSFWDALLDLAKQQGTEYRGYSYARRGDLYVVELKDGQGAALAREAEELGAGEVKGLAAAFVRAARLVYVCGR